MDSVALPMYPAAGATTIDKAVEDLDRQHRSGVVVENGDDYRLIYISDLLQAKAAGMIHVQQISAGDKVLLLTNVDAQNFGVDLVRPSKTIDQYMALFTAYKLEFALAGATPQTAMVVTSSELSVQDLTGGYVCDGVARHRFPKPRVSPNDPCPWVGCRRADGSPSTVSPVV